MQALANRAGGKTEIAGLADHFAQPRFQQAQAFFGGEASTTRGGNQHTHTATTLEHAGVLKLAVGATHRHRVYGVVFSHGTHRG